MVFDKLGLSLYDFLRRNHYRCVSFHCFACMLDVLTWHRTPRLRRRPFSLDLVREFGRQLLQAVACAFALPTCPRTCAQT